jgi:glycine/D-amino acid oxidase-like deaminating enzyme
MAHASCNQESADAVVIGGGFYGCAIAIYLAKQRGLKDIVLVEQESALLTRASYNNQARIHNGYHYPRSFTTAYRSRINLPRFVRDWPSAINKDFKKLYAIARPNSKVTARQFQRFCREIGAKLEPVDISLRQLFEPRLIEEVFLAEEYVFDAKQLAKWAKDELEQYGVRVLFERRARELSMVGDGQFQLSLDSGNGRHQSIQSRYVFNCAYSGLNQLGGDFSGTATPLKQEITEMALMKVPPVLAGLGITVMDGPFFSMMPFPPRGVHTLSHVRYTPHLFWQDQRSVNPYQRLDQYAHETRFTRMLRDASRYVPAIQDAEYVDSLFEIKTVLAKNEVDDGRPILFESPRELPNYFSILGSKIDNVYDVLEKLDGYDIH